MFSDPIRIVTVAMLAFLSSAEAFQGIGSGKALPRLPWSLEVYSLESSPTTVWLGLLNRASGARMVCVLDQAFVLTGKRAPLAMITTGGVHSCEAQEDFHLVRAGETYFVEAKLPPGLGLTAVDTVRVEVGIVDRGLGEMEKRRPSAGIVWNGTLKQAADSGRALTRSQR